MESDKVLENIWREKRIFLTSFLIIIWQAFTAYVVIPLMLNIVVTVALILYVGCHLSIYNFPLKEGILKMKKKEEDDSDDEEEDNGTERLTFKDALKFPIIGSITLFSLYVVFKYFDKEWVNYLLSFYFALIGSGAIFATLQNFFSAIIRINNPSRYGIKFKLPLLGKIDLRFTLLEWVVFFLSLYFGYLYFQTKHWLLNNLFGICFCIQGLQMVALGSYQTGAMLLIGLFFYDIFWVFYTEVMLTVATSFDGPIKLLFLKNLMNDEGKPEYSLLGLGDIVIPGIFLGLLLRYDFFRSKKKFYLPLSKFSTPFFNMTFIGYNLGLLTTIFIMFYFQHAQPALLYLVPACVGFSMITALYQGEFKQLWFYSEEKNEENEKNK